MSTKQILIMQRDQSTLALLTSMLKTLGHTIQEATDDEVAVQLLDRGSIGLVLVGVKPMDADALDLPTRIRRNHREIPVILLFSQVHPERAKEAVRLGAKAILKYPVPAAELRATVMQALESCNSPIRNGADHRAPEAVPAEPNSRQGIGHNGPGREAVAVHATMSRNGLPSSFTHPTDNQASSTKQTSRPTAEPTVSLTSAAPTTNAYLESIARELGLVGNDFCLRQILEMAATIAPTKTPILLQGEPGTGKTLLSRIIHKTGSLEDRPFVTLHCATFTEEVESADLGGYGNHHPNWNAEWASKLSMARGGTLLLDEVSSLPIDLQLQLLRELQLRDYEAISGQSLLLNDVRFIMTTAESLPSLVEQGRFRQELYHRISVVSLILPPLRHRGADIEHLAEHFRVRFAREYHKNITGFARDAIDVLHRHDWPGNLRELEGVIQRAIALCAGSRITASHLAPALQQNRPSRAGSGNNSSRSNFPMGIRPLREALEDPEKKIIVQALREFNWNRQDTARVLDINRTTLYKKMKKYGLLIDEPIWVS